MHGAVGGFGERHRSTDQCSHGVTDFWSDGLRARFAVFVFVDLPEVGRLLAQAWRLDGVGEAIHGLPVDGGGGVSGIGGWASRWCRCGDRAVDRVADCWFGGVDLWALVGAGKAEAHAAIRAGHQFDSARVCDCDCN